MPMMEKEEEQEKVKKTTTNKQQIKLLPPPLGSKRILAKYSNAWLYFISCLCRIECSLTMTRQSMQSYLSSICRTWNNDLRRIYSIITCFYVFCQNQMQGMQMYMQFIFRHCYFNDNSRPKSGQINHYLFSMYTVWYMRNYSHPSHLFPSKDSLMHFILSIFKEFSMVFQFNNNQHTE